MAKKKKFQLEIFEACIKGHPQLVTENSNARTGSSAKIFNDYLAFSEKSECVICVDWREETESIVKGIDKQLKELKVDGFDWAFHDLLFELEGEVLRNNNFLCQVNEQLKQIDFQLVHVNIFDDSYRFFVVSKDAFALIDGMQIKNVVEISDNFGADEYYSLGLLHLKAVGFFQPGRSQDKAAEKAKKQKRQIKSLTKLLSDESVLLEGEDADSLVPPYARFEIPLLLNTEKAEGRLAMDIGLYTSWAARRASQRMFEGKKDAASILVNCWRLRLLERKFEERCFLRILSERSTLESVSFYDLQLLAPNNCLYCVLLLWF
jgi:hypothetical protein